MDNFIVVQSFKVLLTSCYVLYISFRVSIVVECKFSVVVVFIHASSGEMLPLLYVIGISVGAPMAVCYQFHHK